MNRYKHVASLGSSFAAGPGIEPFENEAASRSMRNYPHLLAAKLGARLTDLTISGATTDTIIDTPQDYFGVVFPPQMLGMPADADVVTITAGGNDLQFAGSMSYTAWARVDPDGPVATMMRQFVPTSIPVPSTADVRRASDGLVRIVDAVRVAASGARIVLVDYLTVLDGNTGPSGVTPFTEVELAGLLAVQDGVRAAFASAAERSGAELLLASELSVGHAVGSADPWVFGFIPTPDPGTPSFHPNAVGMERIADALADLLAH